MNPIEMNRDSRHMDTLPILYSFRRCPYAMRARMALVLNNIPVALREVILKDKPSSLLQFSPKGTVPVLVLSDDFVIEESREIIDWAVQQAQVPAFDLPCLEQQVFIDKNDQKFKTFLDKYKYFDRHPEHPQQHYREQCESFLRQIEQRLIHQPYLFSDQISYADIAIFPFIRQFANVDKVWFDSASYPKLKLWLERLLTSEPFKTVMTPYPQWHSDDPVTIFPTPAELI